VKNVALWNVSGPLASALSNRFGCRIVCCVGSAIAALFIFISGFSTNIEMLLITYGVMGGRCLDLNLFLLLYFECVTRA
jgi:MFS family permease